MARIEWQDSQHALQSGAMDFIHREFVVLTNALASAPDDTELACLQRLIGHCRDHFAQEKLWMDASNLPKAELHQSDHDAIMRMLESSRDALRAGRHGAGRTAAEALFNWFEQHSATLDAALAFQLQQKLRSEKPGIPAVG